MTFEIQGSKTLKTVITKVNNTLQQLVEFILLSTIEKLLEPEGQLG